MDCRFPVSLTALAAAALALHAIGPVPPASADLVTEVLKFNGTITDVGVVRGPGQTGGVEYRIKGKIANTAPIELIGSTFTIHQFFVEPDSAPGAGDGAGELMRASQGFGGPETDPPLAPLQMSATQADEDEAKYETPGRFRPQGRVKVKVKEEFIEFDVRLDRGMMRERPKRCTLESDGRSRTPITISFTIDTVDGPITLLFTRGWECPQEGRYHMRARD